MEQLIKNKKKELINLCKSLKIQRMDVFGSAASGRFSKDSDIDLLISFSEDLSIDEYSNNYFKLHLKNGKRHFS